MALQTWYIHGRHGQCRAQFIKIGTYFSFEKYRSYQKYFSLNRFQENLPKISANVGDKSLVVIYLQGMLPHIISTFHLIAANLPLLLETPVNILNFCHRIPLCIFSRFALLTKNAIFFRNANEHLEFCHWIPFLIFMFCLAYKDAISFPKMTTKVLNFLPYPKLNHQTLTSASLACCRSLLPWWRQTEGVTETRVVRDLKDWKL